MVIDQTVFQAKYSAQYKNPRNMVSGVIASSKKREVEKWKDIDFVGYEVIKPSLKPSEQMTWLEEHGVITVIHETVEEISNDMSDKIDCYYHDIESQPNEPTKYSVRGVPTILLFKEGKLLGTKVGASSEKDMLEFIKPHI